MKHISIWRHAKAERPDRYASDFERPLTERGRKDAVHMAALIANLEPAIDLILASPASRTAQTVQALTARLDGALEPRWNETIYLATADMLLSILKALSEDARHVVLVGHNPGLEELTSGLCGSTPEDVFVRMPTAAVAHVVIDAEHWSAVRWGGGQLKLLVTPKALKY